MDDINLRRVALLGAVHCPACVQELKLLYSLHKLLSASFRMLSLVTLLSHPGRLRALALVRVFKCPITSRPSFQPPFHGTTRAEGHGVAVHVVLYVVVDVATALEVQYTARCNQLVQLLPCLVGDRPVGTVAR